MITDDKRSLVFEINGVPFINFIIFSLEILRNFYSMLIWHLRKIFQTRDWFVAVPYNCYFFVYLRDKNFVFL